MGKISPLDTLNPIYEYLPYCVVIEQKDREIIYSYKRTYPPFPWKRDGDPHETEDPIEFINACAQAGLVRWETKEQEKERIYRERPYGESAPVSWEEYQRLKGNS